MLRKRYYDKKQLITDESELRLTGDAEVMICREDKWYNEIVVDLSGQTDQFEELKPFIVSVAENLCKMDYLAQQYEYGRESKFADHYEVAYISLDMPDKIILTYHGIVENTEFEVAFRYINGEFYSREQ